MIIMLSSYVVDNNIKYLHHFFLKKKKIETSHQKKINLNSLNKYIGLPTQSASRK